MKDRILRIDDRQFGVIALVTNIRPGLAEMPTVPALITRREGMGVRFALHLGEDAFRDVVVSASVGGAFGKGELVHEIAANPVGQTNRGVVHLRRGFD